MKRSLRINWIVPEPWPRAGGDVGLFRLARHLAEFGHRTNVYVVPFGRMDHWDSPQIRQYIREHFGESRASYHAWKGRVEDADCTFATFWRTVENVLPLSNPGRRYYLVQDFEPWFYPMGLEYLTAENTYRCGLHCVTLGRWLARLLSERYGAKADFFDFAIDPEIYQAAATTDRERRVCFYARPATPRRAYHLGLQVFNEVKRRLPDTEVVFFGSATSDPTPAFEVQLAGSLPPAQLAQLFSRSAVGLVFSLTNPSFVPLEMAACGCAVVDLKSERMEGVLTDGEDAVLVELNLEQIVSAVVRLLEDPTERQRLAANAQKRMEERTWELSARQIEAILLREANPL